MIQISSGLLRGVPLRSPTGKQTRPSSERLRQGTFNVLRHFRWPESEGILDRAAVIDLFAGTGAWGIEAISNGASQLWFVESHRLALQCLQDNLSTASRSFESQGLPVPELHLLRRDVAAAYPKLPRARVIFCDPPYGTGWFGKILALEDREHRLLPGGVLLYEADAKEELPPPPSSLKLFDTKIYGDSAVHFFVKHPHASQSDLPGQF